MATTYRFYSLIQPVLFTRSKTEILHNSLRATVCPQLEDFRPLNEILRHNPQAFNRVKDDLLIAGYYCLYVGDTLVSIAQIGKNKITRIITLPRFRRQGYAVQLINHIRDEFARAHINPVFCPVDPHAESLFMRAGWVRCGDHTGPDGSMDFCPPECLTAYGTGGRNIMFVRDWVNHLESIQCV
jgi:GNAT superfamily N-acetyltransferase